MFKIVTWSLTLAGILLQNVFVRMVIAMPVWLGMDHVPVIQDTKGATATNVSICNMYRVGSGSHG